MSDYRLVFSDAAGSHPIATTPTDRDTALRLFEIFSRCSIYAPHAGERMRVVDEDRWAAIQSERRRWKP